MSTEIKKSGLYPERLKNIDTCLKSFVDSGQVAGVGALVIRHGITAYRKSFGMQDLAAQIPLKNDSIYRIYSMSKTFTIVAAMTLYEKSLFKLSDPIREFLPAFKNMQVAEHDERGIVTLVPAKKTITFEHLFTMTSGIPYPGGDSYSGLIFRDIHKKMEEDAIKGKPWNTVKMASAVAQVPLCFHPGEYWLYGFSHDVLGGLIEIISGKTLGQYLKEIIFDPLGLKDTSFCLKPEKRSRLVKPYGYIDDKLVEIKELALDPLKAPGKTGRLYNPTEYVLEYGRNILMDQPAFESGGAGLVSTLDDVGLYASMLLNKGTLNKEKVLSRKTIDLIRQNHVTIAQKRNFLFTQITGYGYGLGVRTMMDTAAAGLNGSEGEWAWDGALGTWYCVDPKEDLAAVFLIQRMPGGYDDLNRRFAQTVYAAIS